MRGIFSLLRRFRDDERGVFAVLFGVFAIVLIAAAGAVVDFTRIELARTKAQQALDSAALGLQPKMFLSSPPTESDYKLQAKNLVIERLGDATITTDVTSATTNTTDGTLRLEGKITVPTAFVALIGIPNVTAKIVSEATRKRLNLEIAMVLDNSGSMDTYPDANGNKVKDNGEKSRMDNLILAARCATDVLLSGTTDCSTSAKIDTADNLASNTTNVKIGVVPFTEFVNVGTANKTAAWMDQTGTTSFSKMNFDSDDNEATTYTGTVNRWTLFTNLNVAWGGCVEARKQPYDTTDELPVSGDTLFTPEFAPDEPDSGGYYNSYISDRPSLTCTNKDAGSWVETKKKSSCSSTWNKNDSATTKQNVYNNCNKTESATYTQTDSDGNTVSPAATTMPASMKDKNGQDILPICTTSYTSSGNSSYTLTVIKSCNYQFTDRELQERLCKYNKTSGGVSPSVSSSKEGPNEDCPFNDITPLTTNKTTILAAIKEMAPQGYTNIHQGAIWGYHMLSPTAPLTEAQGYDTSTVKVIILMTDGENTVNGYDDTNINKADGYMAYGYPGPSPYNGRLTSATYPSPASDADLTAAMDERTLLTCTNAKKPVTTGEPDKIVIYTIGLNPPNNKTKTLLTSCATDTAHRFFPTNPDDLTATFKLIADQLANLRLSK
jgi:Flp pilus assembly protein TadG